MPVSVTLRSVCVTIFVVQKQEVFHILSVSIQHAPCYIAICGLADYHIFSGYLINGTIFVKKEVIYV